MLGFKIFWLLVVYIIVLVILLNTMIDHHSSGGLNDTFILNLVLNFLLYISTISIACVGLFKSIFELEQAYKNKKSKQIKIAIVIGLIGNLIISIYFMSISLPFMLDFNII